MNTTAKRFTFTASFTVPRDDGTAHRVDGRIIIDAATAADAKKSLAQIQARHFPLTVISDWQRKI